jgi:hypothetical protein
MTPQDFEARVDWWRVRLAPAGLGHWFFDYDYSDGELEDAHGREAEAAVRVHESYDTAHWHIRPETLKHNPLEIDKVIVHELMHILMRDLNSVEYDLLTEVGGRVGFQLGTRLDTEIEALVERLARTIVAVNLNVVP